MPAMQHEQGCQPAVLARVLDPHVGGARGGRGVGRHDVTQGGHAVQAEASGAAADGPDHVLRVLDHPEVLGVLEYLVPDYQTAASA